MHDSASTKPACFRVNLHAALRSADGSFLVNATDAAAKQTEQRFEPLGGSFEEVCRQLEESDQVFVEPDGSFVYRCHQASFHVDGMIYDADGRIQYIELKGTCFPSNWRTLLMMLGIRDPDTCAVQDIANGVVQSLEAFERERFQGDR
ncbi:MAG: hypothetical protein R3C05_02115 [Pirellulaceae bacterium]